MHRTYCIHDLGIKTAGLLASTLCTITDSFEIVDALPNTIFIVGRHELLRRFAFLVQLIHPVDQVLWNRPVGVTGT